MAHYNFVISQNAKWGHAGFTQNAILSVFYFSFEISIACWLLSRLNWRIVSKLTTDVVTYCTEASNQKSKYAYRKIFFYKKALLDDWHNFRSNDERIVFNGCLEQRHDVFVGRWRCGVEHFLRQWPCSQDHPLHHRDCRHHWQPVCHHHLHFLYQDCGQGRLYVVIFFEYNQSWTTMNSILLWIRRWK